MFVHKLVLSSAPILSEEDQLATLNYMRNSQGFRGVITGTPAYTLWETEEQANAFVPYNGMVDSLIVSIEILPLEQSDKTQEEFYNFPTPPIV